MLILIYSNKSIFLYSYLQHGLLITLTAEEIFQEEVYMIAMKYSAGAVQTESLLMCTEAVL